MKIFINDEEIIIFNGATLIAALRAYYLQHNIKLPCSLPVVTDEYGNSVSPDGELTEGNHFYIRKIKTKKQ